MLYLMFDSINFQLFFFFVGELSNISAYFACFDCMNEGILGID
jgi:hypothetical protein